MNVPKEQLLKEYPESILQCYPKMWIECGMSSRWLECHHNLGYKPEVWEFQVWNGNRIREWSEKAASVGMVVYDDVAFDKWLIENRGRKGWDKI